MHALPLPEDYKDTIGVSASELAGRWEDRLQSIAASQLTEDMLFLAISGDLFNITQWWRDHEEDTKERWMRALIPVLIILALTEGQALSSSFNITITLTTIYTDSWARSFLGEMVDFIYDTTLGMLEHIMAIAERDNWSLRTLRDRIMLLYDQWINGNISSSEFDWLEEKLPGRRADIIAQTLSILTVGMAALALYQILGIEYCQFWTQLDERVCLWCGELHGAVVETGQPFFTNGETMVVNGNGLELHRTVLTPPLHIRCRCFLLPFWG